MGKWLFYVLGLALLLKGRAGGAEPFLQRSWLSEDGLPGNFVRSVVQAKDRFLWVATAEGVVRFDGVRFAAPGGAVDPEITRLRPKALFPQPDASMWIGMESGGLVCWKDRKWTLELPATNLSGIAEVTQVVTGAQGDRYVLRSQEVWWQRPGGAMEKLEAVPAAAAALFAEDARFWRTAGRAIPGGFPELTDRRGQRWAAGPNRELSVTGADGVVRVVLPPGAGITELTEDHEGNIWVAHESAGLRCLRRRRVEMLREAEQPGAATCILEDRAGVLWIGDRRGGVARMEGEQLTFLKLSEGSTQRAVCVLFEDSTGRLWAATRDGSLFVRNENSFDAFGSGPPLSKVNGMAEDASGRLWVTGAYGLALLTDGKTVTLLAGPEAFHGRPASLLITPEQEMWIGTVEGVVYHGRADGTVLPVMDEEGTRLAAGHRVSGFFEDSAGILWAATHGAGLLRRNPGAGWEVYNESSGLPDLRLTAVTEDSERSLWVGSLGGILRLKRGDVDAVRSGPLIPWLRLDRSDGLSTRECTGYNQPTVWRSRDDRLWFPTSRGVAAIVPAALLPSSPPPDPLVESAGSGGQWVFPETAAGMLTAGPGRSRLEFRFTVPSFSAPEKIIFRTRLVGLDDAWRDGGPLRQTAYDAVPAGNYQFQVMAVNGDGAVGRTASVFVSVLPHWWETLAFQVTAGLGAGTAATGAGWLVARRRAKQRIAVLQLRHAQETERSRIARDLHDDLGASLTEISLLAGLSAEEAPEGPHRQSLETIAGRAQHVVGTLDEIVWAVDPRHDTAASLVEYLSSWGQEFLARAGITLRLDIPRDLTDFPMEAEKRHALFLAVREALNNIVKHSGASVAWLRLLTSPRSLTVIIEDTGRGFDPAAAGDKGHGLDNYRERMKVCGGGFSLTTAPGEGTKLQFRIPRPGPDTERGKS